MQSVVCSSPRKDTCRFRFGGSLRSHSHGEEGVPHSKRAPEVAVCRLTIEINDTMSEINRYNEVQRGNNEIWKGERDRQRRTHGDIEVRTMYKRKDKKVRPMNVPLPCGVDLRGGISRRNGKPTVERETPVTSEKHSGKTVPRGSRLTPERLAQMKIGDGLLTPEEEEMFVNILFEYKGVFSFEDDEMGCPDERIKPPVVIHTVPHSPWQQQNIRQPKAIQDAATAIVREKLDNGTLEFSQGPYRSRYFLVPKKVPGEWRFINDVQPLNKVTIHDAGMPPAVDEFSEECAGYPISSCVDFYSSYNQLTLAPESRDLTAFMTALGLVRMTRLPTGWTNSVGVFQRVMGKVLWRHIPEKLKPFLDNVPIRGPKSRYDDEEVAPGIRRFVFEHAQIMREVLGDIWRSGMTLSGLKSAFAMRGINVVGMVCDCDGHHPERMKVQKIVDWPQPRSIRDARAFIGICVYYRIFIFEFSIIAAPIMELFRKSAVFIWTAEREGAM